MVLYSGSIERTSFAEIDEEKGFYEITIHPDSKLTLDFVRLPSRPMVIINLDGGKSPEKISFFLRKEIDAIDENSVVQIQVTGSPSEKVLKLLSTGYIRSIAPKSMNVRFSFRSNRREV
ncbi:hypothetical protein KAH81_00285 [bacterium]|nr:hypothetical protein [bacterium]